MGEEKWARGLIRTQSGEKLRICVKCRGKKFARSVSYPLVHVFFIFSFFVIIRDLF